MRGLKRLEWRYVAEGGDFQGSFVEGAEGEGDAGDGYGVVGGQDAEELVERWLSVDFESWVLVG